MKQMFVLGMALMLSGATMAQTSQKKPKMKKDSTMMMKDSMMMNGDSSMYKKNKMMKKKMKKTMDSTSTMPTNMK
jgi:hypothetical protein